MPSSMLEKAARALDDGLMHQVPFWTHLTSLEVVRAVLRAVREPDEATLSVMVTEFSPPGAKLVALGYWQGLIDAVLGEGE